MSRSKVQATGLEFDPGTHLFTLADESVVYLEATGEIFSLNAAATVIWCLFAKGMTHTEVIANFARDFDQPPKQAEQSIAQIVRQWRELGLLRDGPRRSRPIPPDRGSSNALRVARMPPYTPSAVVRERRYTLMGIRFCLRYTTLEQDEIVHPLFAHLETPRVRRIDKTIEVVTIGRNWCVYVDRQPLDFCTRPNRLAPIVKSLIWRDTVNSYDYLLNIHAGVVGDGSRCVLLPGAAGSGKSMLTAALCHAGLEYFSDEVALLEKPDFRVKPMPLSLCIKDTGWDVVANYYPHVEHLAAHGRGRKIVRYLTPPSGGVAQLDRRYPVGAIVYPRYVPNAKTTLVQIPKLEALGRLMAECVTIPEPLDSRTVGELVAWIQTLPCYQLTMSSLNRAVTLIREEMDQGFRAESQLIGHYRSSSQHRPDLSE